MTITIQTLIIVETNLVSLFLSSITKSTHHSTSKKPHEYEV